MAKTHLFDWDNTVAMILRLLKQPSLIKKFSEYIKPDMIFVGEDSDQKVKGLRSIYRVILDLDKEKRLVEVLGSGEQNPIYAFALEIKRLPESDSKDQALEICDRLKSDKHLAGMAESEGCLNQFIDYLKTMAIREWSVNFNEPYKQGKIAPATKMIKDLVTRLERINVRSFETLVAEEMYSNFKNPNISVNNFKLGIKCLDGLHGFCEPSTFTIFMAPPGGGKSMMTTTLVAQAVAQRKYTNITVVEDRRRTFEPRLMAALTGIPIWKLKNEFSKLSDPEIDKFNRAVKMIAEYLHVDYIYGESLDTIHARKIEVDEFRRASGKEPYQIDIIDYTMHIASGSGGAQDKTFEKLLNAYKARKDYFLKYKKIGFDFMQVNRGGAAKAKSGGQMLDMTDIAGAFDIARVGDNIISINRSDFDKENNIAHFMVNKSRDMDGSSTQPIIVPTDFHIGRYNVRKARLAAEEEVPDTEEEDETSLFKAIEEGP